MYLTTKKLIKYSRLNPFLKIAVLGLSAAVLQAQAITVDLTQTKAWNGGFLVDATITNDSNALVNGWTLQFKLGAGIEKMSRATYTGTDPYTVKNLSYSAEIAAGTSEPFSFNGVGTFNAANVGNCVFNGTACTLTVNGNPVGGGASSTPRSSVAPSSTPASVAASSRPASSVAPSSRPASSVAPSSTPRSSVAPSSTPASSRPASSRAASSTPTGSGMLGQFDKSKDLLLVFHDNKPDSDDIHAQAAIGTMLRDSRFSGVNHHAVQGTIGIQSGTQLNSTSLFNLIYGSSNWSNAIGSSGRASALTTVTNKSISALDAGGEIWIIEAGQSDFSADMVRNIKSQRPNVSTTSRVHIVQHSSWNEDKATASDLTYVKNNTNYNKIGDGNSGAGVSPDLNHNGSNSTHWDKALSMPNPIDDYWREARRLADAANANPTIDAGGMDFSDTVEALWIFSLNDEVKAASDDIMGFFTQFD